MRNEIRVACILGMLLGLVVAGAVGCLQAMRRCIMEAPSEYEALVQKTAVQGTMFGLACVVGTMLLCGIMMLLNENRY